ncbi:uncharacterized protein V1513DRAFT_479353 [Lipomyces chichibuensis]|uniref:uncharacterized protein n=1 Tax=Lipomyces chichibuensis TaxID=1546026 RepID=UPI0033435262
MSMEKSQGQKESGPSDYCNAISLLKNNPPEQRLDIPLSYSQYLELEESWTNIKYPYLSYNSLLHVATVVTVPRDLHEVAAAELRREIMNSIEAYLSIHKPDAIGTVVDRVFKFNSMDFGPSVVVAMEVGSSETYAGLCHDKDLWLDGCHVKVCILVCFKESPRFHSPSSLYEKIVFTAEVENMSRLANECMQSCYGPITYRNHRWLGVLKEGFIEVWRDNGSVRYPLIKEEKAADIPDGDIPINGAVFMKHMETAIIATAVGRYFDFISQPS